MTKEEIKAHVATKIKGQGTAVDMGSALPAILNGIVDIIPEMESGGLTFGGLLTTEEVTIDTSIRNKFYISAIYNSINDGEYETRGEGNLSVVIVDENGDISIDESQIEAVGSINEDDERVVSSGAVYNALRNIRSLDVIDLTACEVQYIGQTLHNDPNVPPDGIFDCKPILVNSTNGPKLAYPITPPQSIMHVIFGDDNTTLLQGGVWATYQYFDGSELVGGNFYSFGNLGSGQGRALASYEY